MPVVRDGELPVPLVQVSAHVHAGCGRLLLPGGPSQHVAGKSAADSPLRVAHPAPDSHIWTLCDITKGLLCQRQVKEVNAESFVVCFNSFFAPPLLLPLLLSLRRLAGVAMVTGLFLNVTGLDVGLPQ